MNKAYKTMLAFILSASIVGTLASTVSAVDAFQLKVVDAMDSTASFENVTIKGYYTDKSGKKYKEEVIVMGDGQEYVKFNPPSDAYGFGYEVVDVDGTILKEYDDLFVGRVDYWATANTNLTVSIVRNDLEAKSEGIGINVSDMEVADVIFEDPMNMTVNPTDEIVVTNPEDTVAKQSVIVNTTADCNLQLIENREYDITVGAETAKTKIVNTAINISELSDNVTCTSPDYKALEVIGVSDNTINVKLTPKCILYVVNGGHPLNVIANGYNFQTETNLSFAVINGDTYEIIDSNSDMLYAIQIPENVEECILDLTQFSGVAVPEGYDYTQGNTVQSPENNTQETPTEPSVSENNEVVVNNPYDIPQTTDMVDISTIIGVIATAITSVGMYKRKR